MNEKSKKRKIFYCTEEEITMHELKDPKFFEGGRPLVDISAWAKKIKEVDPDGKKARALANKYAKKYRAKK